MTGYRKEVLVLTERIKQALLESPANLRAVDHFAKQIREVTNKEALELKKLKK